MRLVLRLPRADAAVVNGQQEDGEAGGRKEENGADELRASYEPPNSLFPLS